MTSFSYDSNGNLLSLTDAHNGTTSYVYDTRNRVTTRTDPLLHNDTYVYDKDSNLTTFTDRRSKVTNFTYDKLNRRTFAGFGQVSNTYESTINYTWDGGDRLTQAVVDTIAGIDEIFQRTDSTGARSFLTDMLGRTLALTDSAGAVQTNYTYQPFAATTASGQSNANSYQFTAAKTRARASMPIGRATTVRPSRGSSRRIRSASAVATLICTHTF